MEIRQYIGARYCPRFVGLYDNTQSYEALDVVDNGSGTSYIAKKPTPANTPLTDTDYWFLYGSTSGAILNLQQQIDDMKDGTVSGSLQEQINDNSSDIQALTNDVTDLIGYKDRLFIVGHDATKDQYTSIQAAVNDAKLIASSNNRCCILIKGGMYNENVTLLDAAGVDFTGIGRVTIQADVAYPDSPLLIGGDSVIKNIFFVSLHSGSYGVHVEGGTTGDLRFINCNFLSTDTAALGIGFTSNRTVKLENCDLQSFTAHALYAHNRADGVAASNQELVLINSRFSNGAGGTNPCITLEDARYRTGTTGISSILNVTCANCIGYPNNINYLEYGQSPSTYGYIPTGKQIQLTTVSMNTIWGLDTYKAVLDIKGNFGLNTSLIEIPVLNADLYDWSVVSATYHSTDVTVTTTVSAVTSSYVRLNSSGLNAYDTIRVAIIGRKK